MKLKMDKFWHKIFSRTDGSEDHFVILPKMVKCASALCHSNADIERSFIENKRMLTKQNTSLIEETVIGLRTIKAAVEESGSVNKVTITLDLLNVAKKHDMEHLRQENARKRRKEAGK